MPVKRSQRAHDVEMTSYDFIPTSYACWDVVQYCRSTRRRYWTGIQLTHMLTWYRYIGRPRPFVSVFIMMNNPDTQTNCATMGIVAQSPDTQCPVPCKVYTDIMLQVRQSVFRPHVRSIIHSLKFVDNLSVNYIGRQTILYLQLKQCGTCIL